MAGAVFGEVGGDFSWQVQHFVTFWDIAGARNVVFYNTKSCRRSDREGRRCEMAILSSDYRRLSIGEALQEFAAEILSFKISWQAQYLGRLLAPRIGNDVSYVMRIKDAIHFPWQCSIC